MSGPDPGRLARFVRGALSEPVDRVGCERLDGVGWYGAYRITARLVDGSVRHLFLKDFGDPRGPKDDLPGRRERERHVYARVLDPERDGTARCYGSEWDPAAVTFWLLLEWVEGQPLRHCELPAWAEAAKWLARFHAAHAGERGDSQGDPRLRHHDEGFFVRTAERAVGAVSQLLPHAGRSMRTKLDGYPEQIGALTEGPPTLVHGAFLPMQILVTTRAGGERLCPLDWELAAWGSPAYDLGFLMYGFRGPDRRVLLDAYTDEAERVGLEVPGNLAERVTLVEAHRTLDALSRCVERAYTDRAVREYLAILDRLLDRPERLEAVR